MKRFIFSILVLLSVLLPNICPAPTIYNYYDTNATPLVDLHVAGLISGPTNGVSIAVVQGMLATNVPYNAWYSTNSGTSAVTLALSPSAIVPASQIPGGAITNGQPTTFATNAGALPLSSYFVLNRYDTLPATNLEAIYWKNDFNNTNLSVGANAVVAATSTGIGNSSTKAGGLWAGFFEVTNNTLLISNTAADTTACFVSQTPVSVGDAICAKIVSINESFTGSTGMGTALVGLFNTNNAGNNMCVFGAYYGTLVANPSHYCIGIHWYDSTRSPASKDLDVYTDVGTNGTIFALAVSLDSASTATAWVQGGVFAQQYGAIIGTHTWYPFARHTNSAFANCVPGVGQGDMQWSQVRFDDATAYHYYRFDPQNMLLDFDDTGKMQGFNVPNQLRLANGGLVVTWQRGTNDSKSDQTLCAQYRSPFGQWYPSQQLLQGGINGGVTNCYANAGCAVISNSIWYCYERSTNFFGGCGMFYRTMTITNGVFTLGAETSFPNNMGTNDGVTSYICNNGIFRTPTGAYIFGYGCYTNPAGVEGLLYSAFQTSTDGVTWTTNRFSSNLTLDETSFVVESNNTTLVAYIAQSGQAFIGRTFSTDDGLTWSTMTFTNQIYAFNNRAFAHQISTGLYGVIGTSGASRHNGLFQLCTDGGNVISTILFGWYGLNTSYNGVEYADFTVDGNRVAGSWSEYGSIHWSRLPYYGADSWTSSENYYGNSMSLSNLNPANFATGTDPNPIYSSAPSSNAPAANELVQAQWVRGLFNNGFLFYISTNIDATATNTDSSSYVYKYEGNIPAPATRTYTAVTNSQYIGAVISTNTFQSLQGPVYVSAYMQMSGGLGGPTVTVNPEIYYSYNKSNWYGDWECQPQSITTGTNLYQYVITFPTVKATNAGGFYIERRYKVRNATGATHPNVTIFIGTNSVTGSTSASHIAFSGPSSITTTNGTLIITDFTPDNGTTNFTVVHGLGYVPYLSKWYLHFNYADPATHYPAGYNLELGGNLLGDPGGGQYSQYTRGVDTNIASINFVYPLLEYSYSIVTNGGGTTLAPNLTNCSLRNVTWK